VPGKTLRLTVHPGDIGDELPQGAHPGDIVGVAGDNVLIACNDRLYAVSAIKPAGGKILKGREFYCGYLSRCSGEHLLAHGPA
jgi:methionyl-tRNA formyltransferase